MSSMRLSGIDAAYLAAELPGNQLHLMAILRLDPASLEGGYHFDKLRAFIQERLPEIPPLRRRLVEVPFGIDRPRWVETDDIDLDLHVRRAALPSPGSARELAAMASEINARPLDRDRPLWEITVVEGLASGEIALIAKLHHAMMDGMVGVRYLAALLGTDGPRTQEPVEQRPADPVPSEIQLLAEAVPEVLSRPFRLARATGRTLFSLISSSVAQFTSGEVEQPDPTPDPVVPQTLFNQRTGPHRTLAYASAPMATIRMICRATDATVNDVVLALVSGAARSYLLDRDQLPEESLVAGIPASTHQEGDELANSYTLLFPTLATDREDPLERLYAIRDSSREQKASRRATAGDDLLSEWTDIPPPWLYGAAARLYVGTHIIERMDSPFFNLLISSVPVPPIPLTFAGMKVTGIHPLGPIYDGLLLNITALGCADSVDFGLVACRDGVPGVWEIAESIGKSLSDLSRAVGNRTPPS
ncbi:MAG: wax ester/triacylglycerol synthase family O-acyltransferase [Deltaproteobacteria bacterium]|nr:wax ester/triacylglycerol synthase family O-acyltransferase [Deltaproteobacteria bacterium]